MESKRDDILCFLTRHIRKRDKGLTLKGICALRLENRGGDSGPDNIRIGIENDGSNAIRSSVGRFAVPFIKGYKLRSYRIDIDYADIPSLDIQNKLFLFRNGEKMTGIGYDLFNRRVGEYRNSRLVRRDGRTMYFRQTINNKTWFTVRPEMLYDDPRQHLRLRVAWLIAKAMPSSDTILMYEKEASRFEESASVLFEKLVEQGHGNVKYIINEGNPAIERMDPAMKKQLIMKDSFEHLLEFFRCKTFIGTESLEHSLHLRVADKHVVDKYKSTDMKYVFLQHGVMYMVSLDADVRATFKPGGRMLERTVVSSEEEARHFVELGGYRYEDLYVTGLAKFDKCYRNDDADLIMIMPTWRRWEANEALKDFENTGYYRMLMRMVEAVPEGMRDRIVIMPHPLMRDMMESAHTGLEKYLRPGLSHDEVLRETRLLITDYSSISYDAFYRGTNVIFCWEDMEECMEHYGGAHLMQNEDNAFGDVTYTVDQLAEAIKRNYRMDQDEEYRRRYSRIVEFHDGHNTDRIIDKLKEDMIL